MGTTHATDAATSKAGLVQFMLGLREHELGDWWCSSLIGEHNANSMQARRKTATPQELLHPSTMNSSLPSLPQTEEASTDPPHALPAMEDVMAMSHPDGACFDLGPDGNLTRVSSAPGSLE